MDRNMHGDLVARAARAAQIALQGHGLRRSQQQSQLQHQHQQQPSSQASQSPSQQPQQPPSQPQPQHSGQSDSQYLHGYAAAQKQGQDPQPYHSPTPPGGYQQQTGNLTFQPSPLQTNFQQYNPMLLRPCRHVLMECRPTTATCLVSLITLSRNLPKSFMSRLVRQLLPSLLLLAANRACRASAGPGLRKRRMR